MNGPKVFIARYFNGRNFKLSSDSFFIKKMVQVIENIPSTVGDVKYETELAVMKTETGQSSIVTFRATAVTVGVLETKDYNLNPG